jgi:hypothetical protein
MGVGKFGGVAANNCREPGTHRQIASVCGKSVRCINSDLGDYVALAMSVWRRVRVEGASIFASVRI